MARMKALLPLTVSALTVLFWLPAHGLAPKPLPAALPSIAAAIEAAVRPIPVRSTTLEAVYSCMSLAENATPIRLEGTTGAICGAMAINAQALSDRGVRWKWKVEAERYLLELDNGRETAKIEASPPFSLACITRNQTLVLLFISDGIYLDYSELGALSIAANAGNSWARYPIKPHDCSRQGKQPRQMDGFHEEGMSRPNDLAKMFGVTPGTTVVKSSVGVLQVSGDKVCLSGMRVTLSGCSKPVKYDTLDATGYFRTPDNAEYAALLLGGAFPFRVKECSTNETREFSVEGCTDKRHSIDMDGHPFFMIAVPFLVIVGEDSLYVLDLAPVPFQFHDEPFQPVSNP